MNFLARSSNSDNCINFQPVFVFLSTLCFSIDDSSEVRLARQTNKSISCAISSSILVARGGQLQQNDKHI